MVLISINSNLNIISKTNIKNSVIDWLKRFPIFHKPITIRVFSDIRVKSSISDIDLIVNPDLTTVESKVEHLLEENKRLESKMENIKRSLHKEIQNVVAKENEKNVEIQKDIRIMKDNLNHTIVGGVKLEVLGILTIFYGTMLPLL